MDIALRTSGSPRYGHYLVCRRCRTPIALNHCPEYTRAKALAATSNWHELGLLSEGFKSDNAFTVAAAAVAFIQGRPGDAIASLRATLNGAPPFATYIARWILAYAAARHGHAEATADALGDYLAWKPRNKRPCLKLTRGFFEAEAALRGAMSIKDVASLSNDLGVLYFSFGLTEEATRLFVECLSRDPGHLYGTINLAMSLVSEGNDAKARDVFLSLTLPKELPSHLRLSVGAVQESTGAFAGPVLPRECLPWYRRCTYSYEWRACLPQLFQVPNEILLPRSAPERRGC